VTEDRIRELLREMRGDTVPADSLARVRIAVERRTAPRSRWAWWWAAVVAAGMAGLMLVWLGRPAARVEQPPLPMARVVEAPPAVTTPVHKVARKKPARVVPQEPIAIRIETADPDVVLLIVAGGAE
jgi:hypothetical protein